MTPCDLGAGGPCRGAAWIKYTHYIYVYIYVYITLLYISILLYNCIIIHDIFVWLDCNIAPGAINWVHTHHWQSWQIEFHSAYQSWSLHPDTIRDTITCNLQPICREKMSARETLFCQPCLHCTHKAISASQSPAWTTLSHCIGECQQWHTLLQEFF